VGPILSHGDGPSFFVGGNVGFGTITPKARIHGTGTTILGIETGIRDISIDLNQANIHVDESTSRIVFKVRLSNGTIKIATLDLF
jgi:hypothetical protein